jgi:Flp pilus assembly protein TadB
MPQIQTLVCVLLATAAFAPTAAWAQASELPAAPATSATSATSATPQASFSASEPAGPRAGHTAAGMRRLVDTADRANAQRTQPASLGKPIALMAVGGAAIFLGAIIGNDIGMLFMIGGAGSLLVGLYQYLK